MGEIVGAALVSHVPTIMLPKEIRLEINEGKEISIVTGLERLRSEILDELKPDTVVVFDTHWATLLEFAVTAADRRHGKFTSEELPRGMSQVPFDMKGNPALAQSIANEVQALDLRCTPIDDPYLPAHYGTINLAHYLNRGEEWLSIGVVMTAGHEDYLTLGKGLASAVEQSDKRVVLLASGSMSHQFWPMNELLEHESSDPKHIFAPEAREADYERLEWFKQGDHASVINTMDDYLQHKPEGRFGHYLMMVGALGGVDCKAKGQQYSDYENAVGTSQVHVWFDRPEGGWTSAD